MSRRHHRVAVLVLEGAKPLDVGIPAQIFTTRQSMPYEVRVCGAHPGLVTGGDGLSYHVADGLEAFEWAETIFIPGYRHPDREDPPAAVVDALGIDRFAVLGHSGGGPHALACAALLPERVIAAASGAGLAPFSADGLAWFDGMAEPTSAALRAAAMGRAANSNHSP